MGPFTQPTPKMQPSYSYEDHEAVDAVQRADKDACAQAVQRLHASVLAGDIDGMRAAFVGRGGYRLGLANAHGQLEYLVLEATLNDARLPLTLLGIFFAELGGRYLVEPAYGICVFSFVIQLEANRAPHFDDAHAAARYAERVVDVVRYLAEALSMPVPPTRPFALRACAPPMPLLEMARKAGAWATYATLAPYVGAQAAALDTDPARDNAYSAYWRAQLLDLSRLRLNGA